MNVKRLRYNIFIIFSLFIAGVLGEYYEIFSLLEDQTISFRHLIRTSYGDPKQVTFPIDKIAIVTIDDEFYDQYGTYPLKRSDIAKIITNIKQLGAKVICLDIFMKYPSSYGEDEILAKAIREAGNVVLASQAIFNKNNQLVDIFYPAATLEESAISGYVNIVSMSSTRTYLSRLRIYPELTKLRDGWPISVQTLALYFGVTPQLNNHILTLGDLSIHLDHHNDLFIDFSAIPKFYQFIHQVAGISAIEFLNISSLEEHEIAELRAWVNDKIVVIGSTSKMSQDWFDTPVGMIYGVEIVADTINTILKGAPLQPASLPIEILVCFLFLSSIGLCSNYIHDPKERTFIFILLILLHVFICTLIYVYFGVIISMSYTLMAGILGFFIITIYHFVLEHQIKDAISKELQVKHESLIKAEQKYRSIFENAIEGIFQTDSEGRIIAVNPSAVKILGYSSAEEMCNILSDIKNQCYYDPNERDIFLKKLLEKDRLVGYETQFVKKDGSIIWVSINAHVVRDQQNNILYYEGSLIDITELKKKEKIEQERKAAEAATKAKSQFLANVSHEIRTPMNAIIGMTQATLKTDLTPHQRKNLNHVLESSRHLLSIINDILDFSKIEAGKIELDIIDFDLEEMIQSIIDIYELEAARKGLHLTVTYHPDVPKYVKGDPGRLRQVLINLIGNAIKFTKKGSIILSISLPRKEMITDNIPIQFSVIDTGIGISKDKLDLIFESFKQADSSISRRFGGSGLGLSICKRLVELMNGTIWVESEVGKGSNFSFIIQMAPGNPSQIETQKEEVYNENRFLEEAPRVLLVEDNPINIQVAEMYLSEIGCQATSVTGGQDAIRLLSEHKFDMVVMDVEMPDMDGFETTKRIRRGESGVANSQIPIIAMTAHAVEGYRNKCIEAGMNDYISKPIDIDHLFFTLKKWVKSKNVTQINRLQPNDDQPAKLPISDDSIVSFFSRKSSNVSAGIDIDCVIKRFRGNIKTVKEVFSHFIDQYQHAPDQMRRLLLDGERKKYLDLIHTVKGVAGTLYAKNLFDVSVELESELRDGNESVENLLDQFEKEIQMAVESIRNFTKNSAEN